MKKYSAFVVYASLALGFVLMVLILSGMRVLIALLGTNEETAAYTAEYLRILAPGAPFMILGGGLGNTIRADGDVKNAMLASLSGTVLNIILDPLFISAFRWGCRDRARLRKIVFGVGAVCVGVATLTFLMQKGLVFLPVLLLMEKLFALDGIIFSNAVTTLISTAIALLLCRSWSRQIARTG